MLGANDGIVSTASLIVGVAAASASTQAVLIAGVAALVAGAMSMAAGEYVSVSSQSDSEAADLARERKELAEETESEQDELTRIYIGRGLEAELARKVALQLMAHDAAGRPRPRRAGDLRAHRGQTSSGGHGVRGQLCDRCGVAAARCDAVANFDD